MKRTVLIGITTDDNVIFAEIKKREKSEFSVCFDESHIFTNLSDEEEVDYIENYLDDMEKDYLYDLCENYNCSPRELPEELANSVYDFYDEFMDCSLYPKEISTDNNDYHFEAGGCGQLDIKKYDFAIYTNEKMVNDIYDAWKQYHLENIPENVFNNIVQQIDEFYKNNTDEGFIKDYIINSIESDEE